MSCHIPCHRSQLLKRKEISLSTSSSPTPNGLLNLIKVPYQTINTNFIPMNLIKKSKKSFSLESKSPTTFRREKNHRNTEFKSSATKIVHFQYQQQLSKLKYLNDKVISDIICDKNYLPCNTMNCQFNKKHAWLGPTFNKRMHTKSKTIMTFTTSSNTLIPSLSSQSSNANQCSIPLVARTKFLRKNKVRKTGESIRCSSLDTLSFHLSLSKKKHLKQEKNNLSKHIIEDCKNFKNHLHQRLQDANKLLINLQKVHNDNDDELRTYVHKLKSKRIRALELRNKPRKNSVQMPS